MRVLKDAGCRINSELPALAFRASKAFAIAANAESTWTATTFGMEIVGNEALRRDSEPSDEDASIRERNAKRRERMSRR